MNSETSQSSKLDGKAFGLQFKAFLSQELPSLRNELKEDQEEVIERVAKKLKLANYSKHEFKSKENKEQFHHKESLESCLEDALSAMYRKKLHEVGEALKEGKF
jgi:hypothetical protein